MFDLTGKAALVTGATGGIGGAIARAFHRQGATVALSGTRRDVLDQLAGELKDRVHVLPCNLADKDEVEALVPKCEQAMGRLDILVANAGITKDNLLVQLRDEDWDQVVAINLTEKLNDKQRETILARVPAGRLGAGADVAAAAVFLASQEAAYITGQTLHVNGGMAMI